MSVPKTIWNLASSNDFAPGELTASLDVVDIWLELQIFLSIQLQTVFTDNSSPKCFWALLVMSFIEPLQFLMRCCQRAWVSWTFYVGLHPCPFLSSEISQNSLYLLMILCAVDGVMRLPKCLAFVDWEIMFLNVGLFVHTISRKVRDWAFEDTRHSQSWYDHLLPMNLFTC